MEFQESQAARGEIAGCHPRDFVRIFMQKSDNSSNLEAEGAGNFSMLVYIVEITV